MSSIYRLGDSGDWDYYDEASHNFSASVDKFMGRHSIKAGFDYRLLATAGAGINCTTGCYTFNSGTSVPTPTLALTWPTCCWACPIAAMPTPRPN